MDDFILSSLLFSGSWQECAGVRPWEGVGRGNSRSEDALGRMPMEGLEGPEGLC